MSRIRRVLILGTVTLTTVGILFLRIDGQTHLRREFTVAPPQGDSDVEEDEDTPRNELVPTYADHVAPLLARYCSDCHTSRRAKGGFALAAYPNEAAATAEQRVWDRVAEAIRTGRMPPPGRPRPEPTELEVLTSWLDRTTTVSRTPGRVTLRRLNRAEYNNTIRDLLGVTFKPATDFPADDSGDGFDTLGDVLSVSPTLIEKYLTAAENVVDAVTVDPKLWCRLRTPPTEESASRWMSAQPRWIGRITLSRRSLIEPTVGPSLIPKCID
jgi:hypothetical protein